MSDDVVYAVFEPSESKLLPKVTQLQLLVQNPILASALSNIFPYLLLVDQALEIVTWTNENPYLNILIVAVYSVIVLYWSLLRLWILPIFMALAFSSMVWRVNSVVHDAKFGEKPTVEEVLLTLHNITVRMELLLRPARNVVLSNKNYVAMICGAVATTPVHVIVTKYLVTVETILWLAGLFFLTYHLPWSYAVRRLVWRSVYVRVAAQRLTGLDIRSARDAAGSKRPHSTISRTHTPASTDIEDAAPSNVPASDKAQMDNDFTVLKKVIESPTRLRQTVRFDVLENERRWLGLGWSKLLMPNERASFCFETLLASAPEPNTLEPFVFPVYENDLYSYSWQWMDDEWKLDLEYNRLRFQLGWVYCDTHWEDVRYYDGWLRYTRSRRWTRRAILVIDKAAEVLDER